MLLAVLAAAGAPAMGDPAPAPAPTPDRTTAPAAQGGMPAVDHYRHAGTSTTSERGWAALPIADGACKDDINDCRYPAVRIGSDGRLTVVWRGRLSGAAIELRLLDDAAESLPAPGRVLVRPGPTASATFTSTSRRHDRCDTGLHLLWRSPSGKKAAVSQTTTTVRYRVNPPRTEQEACA